MKVNIQETNLAEFYSVQLKCGSKAHIFTSYSDAEAASDEQLTKVRQEFQRWEAGDKSASIMIEYSLEANLEGGCYTSHSIHPASLPGGIYSHSAGTEPKFKWETNPGAEKIAWGNLATARPSK